MNDEKPIAPEGYAAMRACYPDGRCIWIIVPEEELERLNVAGQLPLMVSTRMEAEETE